VKFVIILGIETIMSLNGRIVKHIGRKTESLAITREKIKPIIPI